jgi:hypothetical protein
LTLTDFLAHKINLLEADRLYEMDLLFVALKKKRKKFKYLPKTALVRYEFVELLWRLALRRYCESTLRWSTMR